MAPRSGFTAAELELAFSVRDSYGEAKYGTEHPYIGNKYVTEPFKLATFTAVGVETLWGASSVRWEAEGANGALPGHFAIATGHEVEFTFEVPGRHEVAVVVLDHSGSSLARYGGAIFTAFVKREVSFLLMQLPLLKRTTTAQQTLGATGAAIKRG